ncbi:hypothetical protein ACWDDN_01090 [Streptomyces griseoruber]
MRTSGHGRAVVIGASLAGLLAARALHETFEVRQGLSRVHSPPIGQSLAHTNGCGPAPGIYKRS